MKELELLINEDRIAVYDSGGSGPEIVLIHGNSADAQTFEHQLGGDFGRRFRVVAFDLPGHGRSSPAADPETTYCLPGYAGVLEEVVRRLQLEQPVVAGWSLGGHIALEAADNLPQAAGFLIYGTPPLAIPPDMDAAFLPHPKMGAAFIDDVTEEQAAGFADACFRPGTAAPPSLTESFLNTDGRARAMMGASVGTANYTDEVEIVATLKVPLAVLHGAEEQLVNRDYLESVTIPTLWRGSVQIIDGAGHAPHWEQPQRFNALLAGFTADVASGA